MNPEEQVFRARIQTIKFDVKRRLIDVTGGMTVGASADIASQEPSSTAKVEGTAQTGVQTAEGSVASLDTRIARVASEYVDVSKLQGVVLGRLLEGQDMTDCLQQAVVVAEMAMNELATRGGLRFELERWVQSYRDTGGGGHETSAGITLIDGETSQALSLPLDQQAGTAPRGGALLVIKLVLAPENDARQVVGESA